MHRAVGVIGAAAISLALPWTASAKELPSTHGIVFSAPVLDEAQLVSEFGVRDDPLLDSIRWHGGIDLAADWAAAVHAPASGAVVYADTKPGYGQTVDLQVSDGWVIRMAHLSGIAVKPGDQVDAGHVLGAVGSTGRGVDPHLHLETRFQDKQYDPELIEGLNFYASARVDD